MPVPRPRVLIVDDDATIELYMEAVLGHLDLDLVFCRNVAQAVSALEDGPVGLVVTDLMLTGESGLDLIEAMRADPRLGAAPVLVASAAIDAAGVPERLRELAVWRSLCKPIGADVLEACILEALALPGAPADDAVHVAPRGSAFDAAQRPEAVLSIVAAAAPASAAIAEYFGGDASLYRSYRAACAARFPHEIAAGDTAISQGTAGLTVLRHIGHNLATVLKTLGDPDAARSAVRLENHALLGDLRGVQENWGAVKRALDQIAATG